MRPIGNNAGKAVHVVPGTVHCLDVLIESSVAHYFNQFSYFRPHIAALLHLFFSYFFSLILHFKIFTMIFYMKRSKSDYEPPSLVCPSLIISGSLFLSLCVCVFLSLVLSPSCHPVPSLQKNRVRHLPRCCILKEPGIFHQGLPQGPAKNLQGSPGRRSCSPSQSSPREQVLKEEACT